jgi:chloramphenicol O-acetyltransferase type A
MREIKITGSSRAAHYEVFSQMDHPRFSMCAPVDVSRLIPLVKESEYSVTVSTAYILARAANALPEFRRRIRGDTVVEHEVVHPSFTMLVSDDLFSFCTVRYEPDFARFRRAADERISQIKQDPTLKDEPGQDDLLFMTAIPWVSFTSFTHPTHLGKVDSVPRLAWGKYCQDGDHMKMPLDVDVHHALMDGVHVGRFYEKVQTLLDQPEFLTA